MTRKQNDPEPLAPVAEVRRLLALRRAELTEAETALAAAEEAMDAPAAAEATQCIALIQRFIRTLEAREADAVQEEGRARAKAWLASHARRMVGARENLDALQLKVQGSLDTLLRDIAAEASVRTNTESQVLAAQVLAARFALSIVGEVPAIPPVVDYVGQVVGACDALRPSGTARRRFTVAHRASADAEEARSDTLRTVHQWVAKHGETLPSEVQSLLTDAPIPEGVVSEPKVREPSAHEQREVARMFEAQQTMDRTLAGMRGR